MLISKAIVDGVEGGAGKYSAQQRQRLYREGIREFFRLDAGDGPRIDTIGDCGAFQYVREAVPAVLGRRGDRLLRGHAASTPGSRSTT